jgi:hypothetical protein
LVADDYSKPIPTKFSPTEVEFLDALKKRTNISRSEIIRRAVWLLKHQADASGNIHAFLGELGELRHDGRLDLVATHAHAVDFEDPRQPLPQHQKEQPA